MNNSNTASVCIVGAGSMGVLTGYHLGLAGAAVTFLVRPHRQEQLSRPQVLYSYDDHSLKTYSGYDLITDPAKLAGTSFDFVIITLDTASLRAEAGQKVVDEIGRAFRDTSTAVILGSVGIDLRSWFLERSGIADTQVTQGGLGAFAYEAQRATMPLHPGVKPDLLAKADYAYRHHSPFGFVVDLSAPQVANDFAALYDRSGVSQCSIVSADEYNLIVAAGPPSEAWKLLNWPALADIDSADETWRLGIEAMREFQRLSIFGQAGLAASEQTDAEGFLGFFRQLEENTLPLDLAAFFNYHHGSKLNSQSHETLREALSRGEAEGAEMPALRALIARLPIE
ncbi:2-dehydropantoate 2-reductase N-terminal domain-containing protein [Paenibacillus caseinilyticus]|uniref:Ketopantoate reductase n=1 Tax=Paenibacillus mucilaginosus K02 TaxID=997761 RepID=I0BK75_9BACL|nr:2-dehydropantoate 2-reductase N-terminal domain-containing protein [Paenibacillus mucilaginosus]AFH62772.1 ketopantoate reductase [Paenibacillus mucilaginosus K02]